MGCCESLIKILLVLVNVVVCLVWLGLAIAGGLLAWGQQLIEQLLNNQLSEYVAQLSKTTGGAVTVDSLVELVQKYGKQIGIGLFIIGMILFALCLFGCVGACCSNSCLLLIYGCVMVLILLAEIIFVIMYFQARPTLLAPAKASLEETVTKYQGLKGKNPESLLWNLLQPSLGCCGVNSYQDFKNWDHMEQDPSTGASFRVEAPITCCKMDSSYQPTDPTCPKTFNDINSNYNLGCFKAVTDKVDTYSNAVMIACIVIIVFQFLLIVLAFTLRSMFVKGMMV